MFPPDQQEVPDGETMEPLQNHEEPNVQEQEDLMKAGMHLQPEEEACRAERSRRRPAEQTESRQEVEEKSRLTQSHNQTWRKG